MTTVTWLIAGGVNTDSVCRDTAICFVFILAMFIITRRTSYLIEIMIDYIYECCINHVFVCLIDVFTDGLGFLPSVQDPTLQILVDKVPTVLSSARAPSTNQAYGLAYKRWRVWALTYPEIQPLPANHLHVLLYLMQLEESISSYSTINLAICAIKWAHGMAGLESPTDHVLVQEALQGFRRRLARPTIRKEPFMKDHIHRLITEVQREYVVDMRNTVLIVIAYFAMLRVSELRYIQACNIIVFEDRLEIVIPQSKCDQLREGDKVLVAKLGGALCPVELFCAYLAMVQIDVFSQTYSDQYIFRRFLTRASGVQLTPDNIPMTYSRIREIVKGKAKQIGLDVSKIGTHSMRAGGATIAANSGIDDRVLQRHGRWSTATSKNRYVLDDIQSQLSVSKILG